MIRRIQVKQKLSAESLAGGWLFGVIIQETTSHLPTILIKPLIKIKNEN
ncbi:hypothetical protein [Nibribacter koreensis]|uniref:Uncharacterized protein n=1 Tax=Nibribacter koreensis TaxID=1084519 RepID=A0ABP8FIH6_9BACT